MKKIQKSLKIGMLMLSFSCFGHEGNKIQQHKPKCYKIQKTEPSYKKSPESEPIEHVYLKKEPLKIIHKESPLDIGQKTEKVLKDIQKKDETIRAQAPREKEKKTKIAQVIEKKAEKPHPKQKLTTISNSIDLDSLTYKKHWYKPSPSSCAVTINDQEIISIQEGKEPKITNQFNVDAQEKIVSATYRWKIEKFGKIWHEEKKEIQFELLPIDSKKTRTLSFDWETDERLLLTDAKIVSCKSLS